MVLIQCLLFSNRIYFLCTKQTSVAKWSFSNRIVLSFHNVWSEKKWKQQISTFVMGLWLWLYMCVCASAHAITTQLSHADLVSPTCVILNTQACRWICVVILCTGICTNCISSPYFIHQSHQSILHRCIWCTVMICSYIGINCCLFPHRSAHNQRFVEEWTGCGLVEFKQKNWKLDRTKETAWANVYFLQNGAHDLSGGWLPYFKHFSCMPLDCVGWICERKEVREELHNGSLSDNVGMSGD